MTAYSEETTVVSFAQGLYTADLASAIPKGYCAECSNAIPTGTSVETRFGLKYSNVGFNEIAFASQALTSFTHFGPTGVEDNPLMVWGSDLGGGSPELHLIREGIPFTDPSGGTVTNGYFSAAIADDFVGAVNYNGTLYAFLRNQVYKITSIDWVADSFSTSVVTGSPQSNVHPIHFFDRLWTAKDNTLYWTDPPSSPGALPETWNTSTNFLNIVGENGPGKIYKIIPLGSRIYIFTSQGLFGLTITGGPESWYLRPLEENARVNTHECAFETGGLIYYITIYGVFVTNGGDSIKISGPIENYFLAGNFETGVTAPSKRSNLYRISYMDGGLIISISNYFIDSSTAYFESAFCKNFYTRLANVAWSEWDFDTGAADTKLACVQAIADSVESYINKTPLSYMMTLVTDSTTNTPRHCQRQLMVYDGLQDQWINPAGGGPSTNANVKATIKTEYFKGNNPVDFKTLKYAFLDIYMSDKTKFNDSEYWFYEWLTEEDFISETPLITKYDSTNILGGEFSSVKVATGFSYRMAQFQLTLDTNNAVTYKVKDLTMKEHTQRDGFNTVQ